MTVPAILLPLFVQVGLTFLLVFGLVLGRSTGRAPARVEQFSDQVRSQFELPVLFYVLTVLAMATRKADLLFVLLAWVFVITRIGDAFLHGTSNNLTQRNALYGAGAVVLLIMWIVYAVRILLWLE